MNKNKKFANSRSDINSVMKNDMKTTEYYKSGRHKENVLKARLKAAESSARNKQTRIDGYNKNPTLCKCCNKPQDYSKRKNQFCSKSCAASYNNTGRVRTEESKLKTSKSVIEAYSLLTEEERQNIQRRLPIRKKHADVEFTCPVCRGKFMIPYIQRFRKTCGADDCKIQASVGERSYQNGSRKPVWFYNPYENREVLLDSSWEVATAELLIAKNIEWIRPPFIKWQDKFGKTRRYFPDFYLPAYDVYLDPKNPYCLSLDDEKILAIKKQVKLIVGSLEEIITYINKI
jgi:hypothetical protein